MTAFRRSIQIATMLLSLSPAVAWTQQRRDTGRKDTAERTDVAERDTAERENIAERCEKAREILTERHIESKGRWALGFISACPGAVDVLARVWAHPPTDPYLLRVLVHQSGNISDRRILNAAIATLQSTRVDLHRRAALDAVLAQYNPRVGMMSGTWTDPEHRGLGLESDYYQVPGEQPITAADQQRIIDTFRQMSTSATDVLWRRIATRIVLDLSKKP